MVDGDSSGGVFPGGRASRSAAGNAEDGPQHPSDPAAAGWGTAPASDALPEAPPTAHESGAVEADQLVRLVLEAAHGRLLTALSHEFLNQQNGIQVNAQLIGALAGDPSLGGTEVAEASGRVLEDSRRSVHMFSVARALGGALVESEPIPQRFSLPDVLAELLDSMTGRPPHRLIVADAGEPQLTADYLVALCAFVLAQASGTVGEIELLVEQNLASIRWRCHSESVAAARQQAFTAPTIDSALSAALPLLLRAQGQRSAFSVAGVDCSVRFTLPD